ncbi:MAG: response regulator transcription factor [Hyphomicrobiaceae bacterium]|nr:response regulator transcription factor [Hyphomicrobiaceae bacterium]
MSSKSAPPSDLGPAPALPEGAHVLVVDDDTGIRKLLSDFLRANGFRVSTAADGRQLVKTVIDAGIDLVVLDVMLPGRGGFDLCRDLRTSTSAAVIMLTAKGSETDRIVGLELGADDYLAKPFNPRELLARIKAVLRRSGGDVKEPARYLVFDGYRIDMQRRELRTANGVLVDLSAGEYDLLLTLAEMPQRVLSRDQLLDLTRGRLSSGFDRTIDVQVSRLRRKLALGHDGEAVIKTVRGSGYMFLPSVFRE